jgi:hypothetical protein
MAATRFHKLLQSLRINGDGRITNPLVTRQAAPLRTHRCRPDHPILALPAKATRQEKWASVRALVMPARTPAPKYREPAEFWELRLFPDQAEWKRAWAWIVRRGVCCFEADEASWRRQWCRAAGDGYGLLVSEDDGFGPAQRGGWIAERHRLESAGYTDGEEQDWGEVGLFHWKYSGWFRMPRRDTWEL